MKGKLKIVEVQWSDANVRHGWGEPAHEGETKVRRAPTASVGYRVGETEEEILLAYSIGLSQQLCVMAIPKAWINGVKELGETEFND